MRPRQQQSRNDLLGLIDRLVQEYAELPAGVVIAHVVRARRQLARHVSAPRGQPTVATVERVARERITALPAA